MLDDISDFIAGLHSIMLSNLVHGGSICETEAGDLYCPQCQGARRVKITAITWSGIAAYLWQSRNASNSRALQLPGSFELKAVDLGSLKPSLFQLMCLQCRSKFSALVYVGPNGPNLAIFPVSAGGLSTKNTPKNVSYFMDQAYKCQAGGASTGAILIYRAALEQLLHDQKYLKKNITDKIKDLEEDIKNSGGPKWVRDIDPAYLRIIKDLGNEGIHVNSHDTDNLKVLDGKLLSEMHILFAELLDLVYEKPIKRAEQLKLLQDAHSKTVP